MGLLNNMEVLNWAEKVQSWKLHQIEASFSFQLFINKKINIYCK